MGLRRRPARSFAQGVVIPRPGRWATVCLLTMSLFLATLVAGAWPVKEAERARWPSWAVAFDTALWHNAATRNAVAALLLVGFIHAFRQWRFASMVRRPGPIDVRPFVDSTNGTAPVQDLMAQFLARLDQVNLPQPAATPGDAAPVDFLHVVRTAANEAKTPLGTVAGLLPAVHITHAYRVHGVFRRRDGEQPFGLTVHIAALPRGTAQTETFWAPSWTLTVERAAHYVGAYVLPRSKICRRPPWTGWRGLHLPWPLFDCFQQADHLSKERRFDEAVEYYHRAIKLDPINPYLRLELAELQERMGLYLDALATNADVIAVEASTDRRYRRRLDRLQPLPSAPDPPAGRLRSAGGAAALLVARYRFGLLLGFGERVARQWHSGLQKDSRRLTDRDRDRERLRQHLRPWLNRYVPEFARWRDGQRSTRCGITSLQEIEADALVLQAFFQFIACKELAALEEDYRWTRGRRRPGMAVSQTALRLSLLWAPIRLTWTCRTLAATKGSFVGASPTEGPLQAPCPPGRRRKKALAPLLAEGGWPPTQEQLRKGVEGLMRPSIRALREYPDYYNAACIVAVCLLPDDAAAPQDVQQVPPNCPVGVGAACVREDRREEVSQLAVHYLQQALDRTESGFVATRSDWLTSEDPDLVGLRPTDAFRAFEETYFPRTSPQSPRPHEVLRLQMSLYAVLLLRWYAELRRRYWETLRHDYRPHDGLALYRGHHNEEQAWRLVGETVLQMRHWQARLELVRAGNELAALLGVTSPPPAFPDFVDDEVSRNVDAREPASVNALATQRILYRNAELTELCNVLQARRAQTGTAARQPVAGLQAFQADWSDACRRQFELWESLERWLHEVANDPKSAQKTRRAFMRRCEAAQRPISRAAVRHGPGSRGPARPGSESRTASGASMTQTIDLREHERTLGGAHSA